MGIASLKEGSDRAVWRVDICTRRLDKVKECPSANDETTYLVLVLVEDERRGLPVELDGTSSSIDPLARRRRHVDEKTLGAEGALPSRHIESFLRVFKQFTHNLPSRQVVGCLSICLPL